MQLHPRRPALAVKLQAADVEVARRHAALALARATVVASRLRHGSIEPGGANRLEMGRPHAVDEFAIFSFSKLLGRKAEAFVLGSRRSTSLNASR